MSPLTTKAPRRLRCACVLCCWAALEEHAALLSAVQGEDAADTTNVVGQTEPELQVPVGSVSPSGGNGVSPREPGTLEPDTSLSAGLTPVRARSHVDYDDVDEKLMLWPYVKSEAELLSDRAVFLSGFAFSAPTRYLGDISPEAYVFMVLVMIASCCACVCTVCMTQVAGLIVHLGACCAASLHRTVLCSVGCSVPLTQASHRVVCAGTLSLCQPATALHPSWTHGQFSHFFLVMLWRCRCPRG